MDVVVASASARRPTESRSLLSQATRDVCGDERRPAEASYSALGRHRLKDVPTAAQLFQLLGPDLRADFPPLKTLTASSLPALHHRLVGSRRRARTRRSAPRRAGCPASHHHRSRRRRQEPPRSGGGRECGPRAARSSRRPGPSSGGEASCRARSRVQSAYARPPATKCSRQSANRLNGTGALLYLDNLEHLSGAATYVAELLDYAQDLQILATSRAPLRLSTEHVLPLEPLTIDDAATLFVETRRRSWCHAPP